MTTACDRCKQQTDMALMAWDDAYNDRTRLSAWVCDKCREREREPQGEAVRLFTPAPVQLPGQASMDLPGVEAAHKRHPTPYTTRRLLSEQNRAARGF